MPSRSSLRKQFLLFCSVPWLGYVTANTPTLCYVIDGEHNINSGYRCDNGTTGHSTCCAAGATCYSNGLCVQMNGKAQDFLRVGCTDPTWQDPACLDKCTNYARSSTAGVRYCNGSLTETTRYCCDDGSHGVGSFACCANESDIFQLDQAKYLAQVPLDYTPTTSSTASSSSSTSSSTILSTITSGSSTITSALSTTIATDPAAVSSAASLPSPSTGATNSSTAVAIGVGVGVGCGVVALALLGFLFYRHKSKQRQQPTGFKNSEGGYSPQSGGYHDSPIAGANPSLSPIEQKGGYYAPGQPLVGPSPTEKFAGVQRPQELHGENNVFEMPGDQQRMV
ncbi:Axial budding pattern 2 protein [Rutstroemia sp. NJR-2017a BVV2]|nr:Axial budding pattern 2 protein [Rutstroemia sp. NJR-2017a BVV2]